MMIAPRLGQKTARVTPSQLRSTGGDDDSSKEGLEVGKQSDNTAVSMVKPDDSPSVNATVTDRDGANITALPARRLMRSRQRGVVESMWNRWWNG